MSKVIYLIPEDGLGGVEQAARSTKTEDHPCLNICFRAGQAISDKEHIKYLNPHRSVNNPLAFWGAFRYLCRQKPEVLICSLWRASFLAIFYYLFIFFKTGKKIKMVVFVHSARFAHIVDRFTTRLAFLFAKEIWCDSTSTEDAIISGSFQNKSRVVSFFLGANKVIFERSDRARNGLGDFIFWGRLSPHKRLCLALELFNRLLISNRNLKFYIYGPDAGDEKIIKDKIRSLNISGSVHLMGEKHPESYPTELFHSSFFINLSSREGMAISVIEAMQVGLVPVVTPVGEVAKYCSDGKNSIFFENLDDCVARIDKASKSGECYSAMSDNAINSWVSCVDYNMDLKRKYTALL